MKPATLLGIAGDLEKLLGVQSKASVNDMLQAVDKVAGHCRTKRQAAETLAADLYGYSADEYPRVREYAAGL
jgi:hypothetical protein